MWIALAVVLAMSAAWADNARIAVVTGVVRGLEIAPAGQSTWKRAQVWMPLSAGDALRTAAGQQASVMFADSSQFKLDENTEVVVRGYRLEARRGRIWMLVQGNRKPYQVTTPNAVAGIEGTELEIDVADAGATTVRVVHGTVAVSNGLGAPVRVGSQHACDVVGSAAPSTPRPFQARLLAWAAGVRQYAEVKAQVEQNIVGILQEAKSLGEGLRHAPRVEQLTELHGVLRRLDAEIAAFADIEPPPLFASAHVHRLVALDTLSLALRELELGILTQGREGGPQRFVPLLARAQQENQVADRQYEAFRRLYERVMAGLKA